MCPKLRTHRLLIVTAALFMLSYGRAVAQGSFSGRVVVEWLTGQSPERDMRLLEPFHFTDPSGKQWNVPSGVVVNGASIPQPFWSFVGSPYTGNYRRASVVHDYYCDVKNERWEDVHRMFFHAMVAGGVPELEAKVLYGFVYSGGPRWKRIVAKNLEGSEEILVIPQSASISSGAQAQIAQWIRSTNPSLEEMEKALDREVTVQ